MFRDELSSTSGTLSESDRKAILLRCGEARWATDQATRGDCCDPCFRRVKLNWRWRFCQASENCSLLLSVRFVSITRGATYLCETTSYTPFTTGRIQQIVKQYREEAGINQPVHPHLFRHQVITTLPRRGFPTARFN
jgi:integrase